MSSYPVRTCGYLVSSHFCYHETENQTKLVDMNMSSADRVASEREFAKSLFDSLSEATIEATGQKLRVYLDQVRLEDGNRW
jgi:hypothetical protein